MQHFGIARPLDLHILVTIKGLIVYIVYTDDYTGFLRRVLYSNYFQVLQLLFLCLSSFFLGGGGSTFLET